MYKVCVIDDNRDVLAAFEKTLEKVREGINDEIDVSYFSDVREFLQYVEKSHPDIAIIDIVLGKDSGTRLAREVRDIVPSVKLVFVTAFYEFAPDIFSTVPQGLLYKPVDEINLMLTLNKMIESIEREQKDYFIVRSFGGMCNIKFSNLMYIESAGRKIFFHETDRTTEATGSITSYSDSLPGSFLSSHKSFVVNISFIRSVKGGEIELKNGEAVPLSKHRSAQFRKDYFDIISEDKNDFSADS